MCASLHDGRCCQCMAMAKQAALRGNLIWHAPGPLCLLSHTQGYCAPLAARYDVYVLCCMVTGLLQVFDSDEQVESGHGCSRMMECVCCMADVAPGEHACKR